MLKQIIKSLLLMVLFVSNVYADDILGSFNQQGDVDYPEPNAQENYLAVRAPMASEVSKYFGAQLAVGTASLKPEITVTKLGVAKTDDSQSKSATNYGGGIYGGIGTNLSHFYIGSELSLSMNAFSKSITSNVNSSNIELTVKQPFVFGVDIIPGYLNYARDVLLYGRLGVGAGWYKLKFTDTVGSVSKSANKLDLGIRAGLGADFFISDSFGIRTEYLYTRYSNISEDIIKTNKYSYKINSPGAHQINLGLTVRF